MKYSKLFKLGLLIFITLFNILNRLYGWGGDFYQILERYEREGPNKMYESRFELPRSYNELMHKFDSTSQILNVKDFGATGDGVNNDRDAIQSALDLLGSGSQAICVLFFPKGVYKVLGFTSLKVPSNIKLKGCGKRASIISSSASIILDARNTENVVFERLGIELSGEQNFGTGITVDNSTNSIIDNCFIYRKIEPEWGNTIHAILARGAKSIYIRKCNFKYTQVKLAGAARGADKAYIFNNHFEKPYNFAISSVGRTTASTKNLFIFNNVIQDLPSMGGIFLGTDGEITIPVDTLENIYIENNIIIGSWFPTSSSVSSNIGINLKFGKYNRNIHIKGNRIENHEFEGDPNTFGIVISPVRLIDSISINGLFLDNNFLGNNAKEGLRITLGKQEIKNISLNSNILEKNRGIRLKLIGNSANTSISDNSFEASRLVIENVNGNCFGLNILKNQFSELNTTNQYLSITTDSLSTIILQITNNIFDKKGKGIALEIPVGSESAFSGIISSNLIYASLPFAGKHPNIHYHNNVFTTGKKSGLVSLSNGTVRVLTPEVREKDIIKLHRQESVGKSGHLLVEDIIDKEGFTIRSKKRSDSSIIYWEIIH